VIFEAFKLLFAHKAQSVFDESVQVRPSTINNEMLDAGDEQIRKDLALWDFSESFKPSTKG
jgi:hypothetical protein